MHTTTTTLSAPPDCSLKATVLSHGWHECSPMSWCEGGSCLQLIERAGDEVLRASVTGRRGAAKLKVQIEGPELDRAEVRRLRARLCHVLALKQELSDFHELCRAHPTLHVLPRLGAGRLIRSASLAENVIKVICATNVTWSQAVKSINRLAQLGPALPHFVHLNAWPTPAEIIKAGPDYLTGVCRLGYRADFILAFCRALVEGRVCEAEVLAAVREESTVTALRLLRAIRGVDPASAHALLSLMGTHDHLAIDSATVAHVARTHTRGRKPGTKEIERIYAPYGRWRNLVYWFEHWLTWDTARTMLRESKGPS